MEGGGRRGRGADYYILTSHFLSAPGLNSKTCEGMHGGEKLGGHRVNPTQYVHMAKMAEVLKLIKVLAWPWWPDVSKGMNPLVMDY